jgi:4-aminobutyrate aminotransferase
LGETPKVLVKPPGPEAQKALALEDQVYIPIQMKVHPDLVVADGKGSLIRDVDGNSYIDFTTGISANQLGQCHPKVVKAIKEQAEKFLHIGCFIATYMPLIEYCAAIKDRAPGNLKKGKVWFCNTGAESVEAGIKIARLVTKRHMIISFEGSFHGRTLATMGLTASKSGLREYYSPLVTGSVNVPYAYCYRCRFGQNYPDCNLFCVQNLERVFETFVSKTDTAALIAEPIQGEGGIIVPPDGYLNALGKVCDDHDILYILDEVWTGFGRTGKWFATEHWGAEPDMITFAKAAGAGVPIGGVIASKEVSDKCELGRHGTTFGGNPLSCVAGKTMVDVIEEEGLIKRSAELGEKVMKRFREMADRIKIIGDVRGRGLMIGIELVEDRESKKPISKDTWKQIAGSLLKKGLMVMHPGGTYGNVMRLAPALNIPEELLDKGIELIEEQLKEV